VGGRITLERWMEIQYRLVHKATGHGHPLDYDDSGDKKKSGESKSNVHGITKTKFREAGWI